MAKANPFLRAVTTTAPLISRLSPPIAARWLARLFTTPVKRRISAREKRWMDGATRSVVRFRDLTLPLYSWGRGPTVLLVHGWSGRGSQLAVFAAPLVARSFRVVAFDHPAHGAANGKRSGLPQLADAVARVAEELGPLHAIVSHSLGAAATTMAVARGVSAERLIHIAPPEDLPGYLTRMARLLEFAPDIAPRAQRVLERRFGVPFDEARGSTLAPGLHLPLLVIHDRRDREVPYAEGQRLAELWPGATLMTTEGLGHNRIVRDPRVVDAAVDFATAGVLARQNSAIY